MCRDLSLASGQHLSCGCGMNKLPSTDIAIFFGGRNIAIHVRGLIDLGASSGLLLVDLIILVAVMDVMGDMGDVGVMAIGDSKVGLLLHLDRRVSKGRELVGRMATAVRSTSVQRNSQRMRVHLTGRGVDKARLSRRIRLAIALTEGHVCLGFSAMAVAEGSCPLATGLGRVATPISARRWASGMRLEERHPACDGRGSLGPAGGSL
jgi:hypothetical protein